MLQVRKSRAWSCRLRQARGAPGGSLGGSLPLLPPAVSLSLCSPTQVVLDFKVIKLSFSALDNFLF